MKTLVSPLTLAVLIGLATLGTAPGPKTAEAGGRSSQGKGGKGGNVRSDSTPPTIHCPADITTVGAGSGAVVTFSATATDNRDPSPTISSWPASGSWFPFGPTTVTMWARDSAGNLSGDCTFVVTVLASADSPFAGTYSRDWSETQTATITIAADGSITGSMQQTQLPLYWWDGSEYPVAYDLVPMPAELSATGAFAGYVSDVGWMTMDHVYDEWSGNYYLSYDGERGGWYFPDTPEYSQSVLGAQDAQWWSLYLDADGNIVNNDPYWGVYTLWYKQ